MNEQGQPSVRRKGTLVSKVTDELRDQILSGAFPPGARLPSEAQLTQSYNVSRTVVREAIAVLRADLLVDARQGSGVYVRPPSPASVDKRLDRESVTSVLELLEIRTPLEIEAAGLAALRRSPAQEERIFDCQARILACIEAGRPIRDSDFALHLAISEATNNPGFAEFLKSQGVSAIPQAEIVTESDQARQMVYFHQLNAEHEKIVLAISNGDEEAAREAMRAHLKGSQERHRQLLRGGLLRQDGKASRS
ncbi:DNA-binding transcriptional regulator, FadR family [Xaviernesmea oryzae]|nr:DNA-binding transcriptional regulator, FadR family [Xaviernesmea oryzae]